MPSLGNPRYKAVVKTASGQEYDLYKSKVVVKEVYNGVLDFYVDYGFASSIYDDWFWKIFYEKGSKGNKFSIWISDFDVYEE